MFKKIKFPLLSDMMTTPFKSMEKSEEENISGLKWKELINKGYVKESITLDDDMVTINLKFISRDNTFYRYDKMILPKEDFDKYVNNPLTPSELNKEIYNLKEELKAFTDIEEYEICATLKDQIKFLEEFLNENVISEYGKNR